MGCYLCDDVAAHNRFCQEHRTKTPRASKVAALLGVSPEDIVRHRRHEGCYTVRYPAVDAEKAPVEKVQGEMPSQHDPLTDLQNLRKILNHFLVIAYREKNTSPGDIVRVTAELRSLIVATEDLQIKLEAAAGGKNSAFTQTEMQEIYGALQDLCPVCKEHVCGKLMPST